MSTPASTSSRTTARLSISTPPNQHHKAILHRVGAHLTSETGGGGATTEHQERGHNRGKERPELKAYVEHLVTVFSGHGHPVCEEIEGDLVKVDHGQPEEKAEIGERRKDAAAPWTSFTVVTEWTFGGLSP